VSIRNSDRSLSKSLLEWLKGKRARQSHGTYKLVRYLVLDRVSQAGGHPAIGIGNGYTSSSERAPISVAG